MANPAQHGDFGEKIGGAKKDLWRQRGLLSDDLNEMNSREAEKHVRKDNVWKKPDYQAMIDGGVPFDVVYFIKKARDSLNASPQYYRTDDTPEKRLARQKQYIETVREVQAVMEDVRTRADAMRAYDRALVDTGYIERIDGGISGPRYAATEKGQENPVITNKLHHTLHIRSDSMFEYDFTKKAQQEQFGVPKEEKVPKGYEVLYHDGKNSWSQNDDWLPGTWYVAKARRILKTNFDSREAALQWVQELTRQRGDDRKKRFVPPQLEHIRRDGPDYRRGRDATGQDYLDTFGFKGGEFGNWMTQSDRRASLDMGFDALKDLADALHISDKDISYQGALSIAFGSRGSGNAVAHYEPLRQVINLTKMRGAGSLAHEWWHGLDDYLGQRLDAKGFLSENPRKHPLFQKLLDTIKYKPESPEQAAKRAENQDTRTLRNAESWLDHSVLPYLKGKAGDQEQAQYETLKAAYLRGEPGSVDQLNALKKSVHGRVIPKDEQERLLMFEGIMRSMSARTEAAVGKTATEYYTNSKEMGKVCEKDGGYWDSNVELTARAFATYMMDKLARSSDYLVGHAECAINIIVDKDGTPHLLKAYPQGEERKAINAVFDELVAELKLQRYLTHDDRVRPEPKQAAPVIRHSLPDASFEQLTFDNMFAQASTAPVSSIRTSVEFFRQEQGSADGKLTLYEYGDRVELHRPNGIERLTPADGQTAKDVLLSSMNDLLNDGYCIRCEPPVANDPQELLVMRQFLNVKLPDNGLEP